MGDKINK
jgi:adenylate kinase family enzyme